MGTGERSSLASSVEPLPEGLIHDLSDIAAYPDEPPSPDGVECVQTHLSHVFLTASRAIKLRKAVHHGFVDFSSRASRDQDCLDEVALNRRLSDGVYLGIAPVVRGEEGWRLGEVAESLSGGPEHAVVMRRLPQGDDALSRVRSGRLDRSRIETVATVLATFHAAHPSAAPAAGWRERVAAPMRACIESLRASNVVPAEMVRAAERSWHAAFEAHEHRFAERADRIVEGHGDLRLEHIWFEENATAPQIIDCVEFDPALRRIDPASEVAFLAMDLRHRDRADLAEHFLASYAAAADDYGIYAVVDPYIGYRAAVRAKVAALAAADPGIDVDQREAAARSARAYLELSTRSLAPRAAGPTILTCGTVGTGKSTAARGLATEFGDAVVISTDRVRRSLFAASGADRYTPDNVAQVYRAIMSRAEPVAESGRPVILDATFSRRTTRAMAAAWSRSRGSEPWLVHVDCAEPIARERLRRRSAEGTDPSDAGPERLEPSRASFEPPSEWPKHRSAHIDSGDTRRFAPAIAAIARRIANAATDASC